MTKAFALTVTVKVTENKRTSHWYNERPNACTEDTL